MVPEYVWSLPRALRRGGELKALLKSVLQRYMALVDRPKRSFSMPFGQWLSHPLRCWAEDLMALAKFADEACSVRAQCRTLRRAI